MPYRVTFAIDARQPLVLLREYQAAMLECLTRINSVYLANHVVPALERTRVQIAAPTNAPADYRDIPTVLRYEAGTVSDLSAWRAAVQRQVYRTDAIQPALVGPLPGPRTTFALDAFNGTLDADESERDLSALLDCLVRIDELYLLVYPSTPLFRSTTVRYSEEPPGLEDWQDIATCLRMGIGDCLPVSTLVLREDYTFAPIVDLKPGDRIMGDGQITTVQEACVTGMKPVLEFALSNGSVLRASPDHRLFTRENTEIRAKDVTVGTRLRTPSAPFPAFKPYRPDDRLSDTDFAWLVGTYVADGWHTQTGNHQSFSISGYDLKPKRRKAEQKLRVQEMCDAAGVKTSWYTKSIRVADHVLSEIMHSCGTHAPVKSLPTMKWSLEQVRSLVEGLKTDSSISTSGTTTYGTTSPTLALQLRVLHRMLDQSVHIRSWSQEEHRGLGKNAMYRVGLRRSAVDFKDKVRSRAQKSRTESYRTSVTVRSISKSKEPELCADITTDTGRFYLPESDTIVHNCEDLASWRIAELRVRFGVPARPLIIPQLQPNGRYLYHVQVWTPWGVEDPSRERGMGEESRQPRAARLLAGSR